MNDKAPLIVVSAVGLRQGGTLTILRDCLQHLSTMAVKGEARVVALVHARRLADFPGIEYVEMPSIIKSWARRLWCEYVTMHRISKHLPEADLWLSLHDTTPRVHARRQAVYCQTSFPFYRRKLRDFYFNYKIALFSLLTRFAYQINVRRNRYLIVQQPWMREGLSRLLRVDREKFIVAPPPAFVHQDSARTCRRALFHFHLSLCARLPQERRDPLRGCEAVGAGGRPGRFKVVLTLSGQENRYTRWLHSRWGGVGSVDFAGYMSRERLYGYYEAARCLVFPSKVETWGLPISEFGVTGKPMLLADLPYAHGTAAGFPAVAFFNPARPEELKKLMRRVLEGDLSAFTPQPSRTVDGLTASSWKELFETLLDN